MTSETLPILITGRAAIGSVAVILAFLLVNFISSSLKKRPNAPDLLGVLFGAAVLFAIPLAIAAFVGLLASSLLVAIDAPALTYVFLLFLALLSFRAAVKHPSSGMDGCTKMFALIWSGYAIVWSLVSFEATRGLHSFEADALSLRWLQPLLAALPFAIIVWRLAGKKRSLWLFLGTLAFCSAAMALIFYPVENGFAGSILPASDWLRFPLAGLGVAVLLTLVRLFIHLQNKPNIRRARRRDLIYGARFLALVMIAFGLAWATARTVVGTLA